LILEILTSVDGLLGGTQPHTTKQDDMVIFVSADRL
jgi:hypothetical protein